MYGKYFESCFLIPTFCHNYFVSSILALCHCKKSAGKYNNYYYSQSAFSHHLHSIQL